MYVQINIIVFVSFSYRWCTDALFDMKSLQNFMHLNSISHKYVRVTSHRNIQINL